MRGLERHTPRIINTHYSLHVNGVVISSPILTQVYICPEQFKY